MFTDIDGEPGTLDLNKCGDEANLYRTRQFVADRRAKDRARIEAAKKKQEADKLAKTKGAAEQKRRRENQTIAEMQREASKKSDKCSTGAKGSSVKGKNAYAATTANNAAAKSRSGSRPTKGATRGSKDSKAQTREKAPSKPSAKAKPYPNLKRVRPSDTNDSGADMLMAAAALIGEDGEGLKGGRGKKARGVSAPAVVVSPVPVATTAKAKPVTKAAPSKKPAPSPSKKPKEKTREQIAAELHHEKFLKATAAANKAKADAAQAKAKADAAFEAAKRLENSPAVGGTPRGKKFGQTPTAARPGAAAGATKTSLKQRLFGGDAGENATDKTAKPVPREPSSSLSSSSDDGSNDATATEGATLVEAVEKNKAVPSKPSTEQLTVPKPASKKTAQSPMRRVPDVDMMDANLGASQVFSGATPTSWIIRLLVSRMSGDPTIRAVFFNSLCAMEEKHFDFAARVLQEHDFSCGWRFRLLEYLDRARGLDASASANAEKARLCEQNEQSSRSIRVEMENRELDLFLEQERVWNVANAGGEKNGKYSKAPSRGTPSKKLKGDTTTTTLLAPEKPLNDESDPFLDERPGAGLKILPVSGDGSGTHANGSDRYAIDPKNPSKYVKASPEHAAACAGVTPSGPLPIRGAAGYSTNALGLAFKILMDNAGASDEDDWNCMRRLAKRDAAARPTEALTLTLSGLLQWRSGDLENAKAPLRSAMHHDGTSARAAPLLFEVLLTLNETDEAEVVWDTALQNGEVGATYERLIAVALRCGENENENNGESEKEATS